MIEATCRQIQSVVHGRLQSEDLVLEAIVVAVAHKLVFTGLSTITMNSLRESGSFAISSATVCCAQTALAKIPLSIVHIFTNHSGSMQKPTDNSICTHSHANKPCSLKPVKLHSKHNTWKKRYKLALVHFSYPLWCLKQIAEISGICLPKVCQLI